MKLTKSERTSLTRKLVFLAGGSSVAFVATAAHGDIVASTTTPVSPPSSGGSTFWDVDGDGNNDFELRNYATTSNAAAYFGGVNGGGLAGFNAGYGYVFDQLNSTESSPTGGYSIDFRLTSNGFLSYIASYPGWDFDEPGFFGFTFESGGNTHSGWGELVFSDDGTPGDNFTITEAYYETTPDTTFQVGETSSVPEPSSLLLLSMGVAGLGLYRRRRI